MVGKAGLAPLFAPLLGRIRLNQVERGQGRLPDHEISTQMELYAVSLYFG